MSESCMLSLYHSGLPNNPYAEYDAAFCSNATLAINQTSCETTYWPMCEWRSSSATTQCALKSTLVGTTSEPFSALCDTMAGDAYGCSTYFSEWCDATFPATSTVTKCWPKYGKNAYAPFCAVSSQGECESAVRSTFCEWGPEPTSDNSASKCRTVNSNYTAICNMYFDDQASCQLFETSAADQSESALCKWSTAYALFDTSSWVFGNSLTATGVTWSDGELLNYFNIPAFVEANGFEEVAITSPLDLENYFSDYGITNGNTNGLHVLYGSDNDKVFFALGFTLDGGATFQSSPFKFYISNLDEWPKHSSYDLGVNSTVYYDPSSVVDGASFIQGNPMHPLFS